MSAPLAPPPAAAVMAPVHRLPMTSVAIAQPPPVGKVAAVSYSDEVVKLLSFSLRGTVYIKISYIESMYVVC